MQEWRFISTHSEPRSEMEVVSFTTGHFVSGGGDPHTRWAAEPALDVGAKRHLFLLGIEPRSSILQSLSHFTVQDDVCTL
jgi:hypothetical protein